MRHVAIAVVLVLVTGTLSAQSDQPTIFPVVRTAPLASYEEAPATPDADDPAIWVNPDDHRRSLVIGTAKDAGIVVHDLSGRLVQALLPPNAPQILDGDPPTPGGTNTGPANPCADSASGETFGRYNNVDIAYDLKLGRHPHAPRADVAVVSDRGCDRVRFFKSIRPAPPVPSWTLPRLMCRASFPDATTSRRYRKRPATARDGRPIRWMIRTPCTG